MKLPDNGGEFIGWEFIQMLRLHQIKDVPTTVKNPQANAICERMHQTVSMLPTMFSKQTI
jgi:transposase InsO family protein